MSSFLTHYGYIALILLAFLLLRFPERHIRGELTGRAGFIVIVVGLRAAGRLRRLTQDELRGCRFCPGCRKNPYACKEQSA